MLDRLPVVRQPLVQVGRPLELVHRLARAVRRAARQHAVQQRPQGVDVPAGVGHGVQIGLLGRHVEHRPQRRRLLGREPRLTEIGQPRLAVLVQEDVGRLQVAVQHALAVGVDQARGHVAEQRHRLVDRHRARRDPIGQRALFQVLHDVVRRVGVPTDAQELHHVAVGEQEGEFFDLAARAATSRVRLDGRRT